MNAEDKKRLEKLVNEIGIRPSTVLKHLLKKGEVSTYELGKLGYDQPPRAAMDLKEHGVKLKTKRGRNPKTGHSMVIYMLADDQSGSYSAGGRIPFPKSFRESLITRDQSKCVICDTKYSPRYLQIDHKIPFIVAGESKTLNLNEFQLLCGSHQRMKSWECEHCPNRITKSFKICSTCYWASPENYNHVATQKHKVISLKLISEEEIAQYDALKGRAEEQGMVAEEYIKLLIAKTKI